MKNYFCYSVSIILLFTIILNAQTVTGKLVDENGAGLAGVRLQLYTSTNVYEDSSSSDGTFSFNIITDVEDNQLPTGYSVSDNFPNPFNPRTRINITLPNRENVKVEVFNLLGQSVADVIKQTFDAGSNYIDIELNGLPNGFYISRISIGDKYTVVKKLMLIYGSQHLVTGVGTINTHLNKSNNTYLETNLDSLVATSLIIGRKTFTGLPSFVSGTLDLGNLTIERYCSGTPTVLYEGKTYHTVQIGNQCWLKENLDLGIMINSSTSADSMQNNGILEKYCYENNQSNCTTYGGLYQWNEAMQYVTNEGVQGICPVGWHIPTSAEFYTLVAAVNNNGNALKEIGQGTGGGAGTNTSGYSALLTGSRYYGGGFIDLGYNAYFWSSTEYSMPFASALILFYGGSGIGLGSNGKVGGFSVRCVKD
jgi:uncharacterized protein (TIGR02145 family)